MATSRSGFDLGPLPADRVEALAAGFTPDERRVILHQGTERPFCGLFLDNKKTGTYVCEKDTAAKGYRAAKNEKHP